MANSHIVKSFEDELSVLDRMIAEMGGLAETQLEAAAAAMVNRDVAAAAVVKDGDKKIDDLERAIDEHAIRTLALRQPMANDLRVVVMALKTASMIERIGDYAKNIAKRTEVLALSPQLGAIRTVQRMTRLVQIMIHDVLDAYVTRDAVKANQVRLRDEEVDALHTSLFRELLTYMMEDPRNIAACTHMLFITKNIERIGDHATNIAENVHFLVNGEMPREDRPKGGASVYVMDGILDI